jgi:hypothetical protein
MIELNSVSLFGKNSSSDALLAPANQSSSSSFQNQLSAALTATLEKFGVDPSKINITIGPISSGGAANTPASSTPAASTRAVSSAAANIPTNSVPAASVNSQSNAQTDAILSFDDSYWASQPKAVQALRTCDDPDERSGMAAQLAASGYKIDVPIMVWGWDPSKVTDLRKSFGYTWVPAATQAPVQAAPGITWPGALYDPNNPPEGSIMV